MFYTWGVWTPLCSYMPHTFVCPYICMPQGVYTPYVPILLCLCSQRLLHVVGVVMGPLHVRHVLYTSLYMGVPPLRFTPHSFIGSPVHQYVLGISICDMGNISLMLGIWGVFVHLLGILGASAHGVSICLFLYIL